MRRLSELEHHEIRDVDNIVDRPNTDRFDFRAQPSRARADYDVFNAARGIERAFVRRLNLNAATLFRADFETPRKGVPICSGGQCRDLARQAIMTEQIAAVRRDLDIENGVIGK